MDDFASLTTVPLTPGKLSIRLGVSSGKNGEGVVGMAVVVFGIVVVVVGTNLVVGASEVAAAGSVAKAGKMPRLGGCDGTGCASGPFVGKAI